jgi:D-alanyl-D-alanine carboxypeptidase
VIDLPAFSRGFAAAFACASVALTSLAPTAQANPFLLYDPITDQVLDHEDADMLWHPASLTKMMTAYLTFETVKAGRLSWTSSLVLSQNARSQPAMRIGLRAGIDVNIDQAVRALIMRSANDFAVALAENVGGSEEAFIVRMNETAKRIGMSRTHFTNPHGLPDEAQVTTARDMALLATAIYRDFPEHADVFSGQDVAIGRARLRTINGILRSFPGADGMKTGFTCSSGFNIVASATRNGHRLIAVVLGQTNGAERTKRAEELLMTGFALDLARTRQQLVRLSALPLAPMEQQAAVDLARLTHVRKCGHLGPARVARQQVPRQVRRRG